jgi:hypothetical protein
VQQNKYKLLLKSNTNKNTMQAQIVLAFSCVYCYCKLTATNSKAVKMQHINYASVANNIATYNCKVIVAAQCFAITLATQHNTYSATVVSARKALSAALKNDCKTHTHKCFAQKQMRVAIKQHKNEMHFEALHTIVAAMLQRSSAVQYAYT